MKIQNIFKIVFICFFIISLLNPCFATTGDTNANFDVSAFETNAQSDVGDIAKKTMGEAVGIVKIIGTGISITMLTVIAIKYMIASAGERAEIKKYAIPFVIGAVVLFGASNILDIIIDFAGNVG